MAPAATPPAVVDKLAAACARAVKAPELVERFRRDGIDPGGGTPASFGARIGREIAQWREVIRAANIKPE